MLIIEDEYGYINKQIDNIKNKKDFDTEYIINYLYESNKALLKSAESYLKNCLIHMLKCKYQPEKTTRSWHLTIENSADNLIDILDGETTLTNIVKQHFNDIYQVSRKRASLQTGLDVNNFPTECEWTLEQLLDIEFIYEFLHKYSLSNNNTYYE